VLGLLLGGVWTFGHANVYVVGFSVVGILLVAGLLQSWLIRSGRTLVPRLPARRGGKAGGTKPGDNTERSTRPFSAPTVTMPNGAAADPASAERAEHARSPKIAGEPSQRRTRKAGRDG